jgi:hypothetical protein
MDVPLNNLRACVFMIAKDLIPEVGANSFAIMKCRIPDVFMADDNNCAGIAPPPLIPGRVTAS